MLLMRGRRAASLRVRRISDLKYGDMGEIIRIEASEDSAGDRLDSLLAAELIWPGTLFRDLSKKVL